MSERIRSLEDALQQMQSQHSSEPHPLLRQELLAIKRSPELFGVERERNGAHQLHGQDHRRDDDDHLGASSSTSPGVLHDEVGLREQARELCHSLTSDSNSMEHPHQMGQRQVCPISAFPMTSHD